ncbi:3-oxoacyl-[acyl-carrier-protein] synthase KASIII [Geitlerinema sp. FC II]|nr:3-oxoacyl-[acyl-carrier-protein] synthase KASIII [Geitlerinema sp. FC II]
MTTLGIAITGSGGSTPNTRLDNDTLSQIVETSDEWISTRTGIRQRRLASPEMSLSELAAAAAQEALEMAGLSPSEVDLVVLATSTPDDLFGSASRVQHRIGAPQAVAFDLTAACSGFVFGLVTVAQFLRTGVYRNAVLIGADILSRWVDWSDRRTCVLFGDGAGAVVLQRTSPEDDGLLGFELRSNGAQNGCLTLDYSHRSHTLVENLEVSQGNYSRIAMNGQEIYKFAVKKVPEAIEKALFRANLTNEDLDWLLLHQANQRILDAVAKRLNVPSEKVISNLARYGNTSAASIPLALDEAVRSHQIQTGDTIAASGFGAGLTWGAAIVKWGGAA